VVRDSAGHPLRGAAVDFTSSIGAPFTTGADGRYTFSGLNPGSYTLRAERMCMTGQTQSVTVDGQKTLDFTLATPTFPNCEVRTQSWVNGTTVLPLTGDDASASVVLPFTYRLYGRDYTVAHVSTNGHVNFLAPYSGIGDIFNTAIPDRDPPNAALYPFWDNLDVDASSRVLTATVGTSGNRRFVIEWFNVRLSYESDTSRRFDVEVVIPEDRSQRVLFQYRGIDAGTFETGRGATIGTENLTGDAAHQLSFNQGLVFDGLTVAPK
jgi:hypothetical protein